MSSTLIRGGTIVTALDTYKADIRIRDGRIDEIGHSLQRGPRDGVVDASGKLVMPGGIDPHTHMELPFMGTTACDSFFTGTRAGLVGGTTSIVDFVIPSRGQSLLEALDIWNKKAEGAAGDYAFHMVVTWWDESVEREMEICVKEHGITSFKTFMAYKGALGIDDNELYNVMKKAKELNAMTTLHCENADLVDNLVAQHIDAGLIAPKYHATSRPPEVEGEATGRAIALARMANEPIYIVHLTCDNALSRVRDARYRGQTVWAETCIQYLLLDDSVYEGPDFEGAKYVMSPPIRPAGHQEIMWNGVKAGLLQTVATDHCPFMFNGQKDMGRDSFAKIPNGGPGVQERMSLLWTHGVKTGRLTRNEFVAVASTNAAKLFDLYPRKGAIQLGADADLVVWDPDAQWTITVDGMASEIDYTMFEGWEVQGRADKVLQRGEIVVDGGDWCGNEDDGVYLRRTPTGHNT